MESNATYQQSVETVISALESDAGHRLSSEEAACRLERYGPNELEAEAWQLEVWKLAAW